MTLNRRHKLFGHLFSRRYESLVVGGNGRGHLKTVRDYDGYGGTNPWDGVGHNLTCGEAWSATGLRMDAGTIVGPQL